MAGLKGVLSEMGAALVPRSRGPSIREAAVDMKISGSGDNMPRGYTTIDIDPGLSFEDSEEEKLLEDNNKGSGVELLGSKVRVSSGTSLVSSRSKRQDENYLDGPQNTDVQVTSDGNNSGSV